MSESETDAGPIGSHQQIYELIPWYVNDTLSAQEVEAVEAHLATCSTCRTELDRCRQIASAACAQTDDLWAPSPEHFQSVLAQIDKAEGIRHETERWWEKLYAPVNHLFTELWGTTPRVRWTFAIQSMLVVGLLSALVWQTPSSPTVDYRTLSTQKAPFTADSSMLRVVFDEAITEKQLRTMLTGIQATIVQGPTPMGVYTVKLASIKAQKAALTTLRNHPMVQLAEPIVTEQSTSSE